ncbi:MULTISPECIES: hypothetical protein [Pontibacillus]|uniref:Uncharacterized protein n=1 Tax=Pontibacillus chungwhensis TaxID=265426 RepID=A0ABY8UTS3_9BACI|nr:MULTISPECIES: hypothetical protein [Pontibacillus]MCD5323332.1 hypothetical protein [Pontibacillus sp. HN14]WIF96713.1 hypothetical protein QNI29_13245 [Pontibacillus chungwhensis]
MEKKQNMPLEAGWPWKDLIGFILSILLTAFSLGGALYSSYDFKLVLFILAGFSFVQAMIQLYKLQPQD